LFAHWDSRPYADEDPDKANHYTPIVGRTRGERRGVLLEIARLLNDRMPDAGVDIIFFDAEDYGTHSSVNSYHRIPGVWVRISGRRIRMCRIIARSMESCWNMVGHRDAVFYRS
jgi:hypothetical protein